MSGHGYMLARKTSLVAHNFSAANSHLSGKLVDSISNIINAKIFSNIAFEATRIEEAVNTVGEQDKLLQRRIITTDFFQNMILRAWKPDAVILISDIPHRKNNIPKPQARKRALAG